MVGAALLAFFAIAYDVRRELVVSAWYRWYLMLLVLLPMLLGILGIVFPKARIPLTVLLAVSILIVIPANRARFKKPRSSANS